MTNYLQFLFLIFIAAILAISLGVSLLYLIDLVFLVLRKIKKLIFRKEKDNAKI